MNDLLLEELNKHWTMSKEQATALEQRKMTPWFPEAEDFLNKREMMPYLLKICQRIDDYREQDEKPVIDLNKMGNVIWLHDEIFTPAARTFIEGILTSLPPEEESKMHAPGSIYYAAYALLCNDSLPSDPSAELIAQTKRNGSKADGTDYFDLILRGIAEKKEALLQTYDKQKIMDEISTGINKSMSLAFFHYTLDIDPDQVLKEYPTGISLEERKQFPTKEAADAEVERRIKLNVDIKAFMDTLRTYPDRILALTLINRKNKEDNVPPITIFNHDDLLKKINLPDVKQLAQKLSVLDIVKSMEEIGPEVCSIKGLNKNMAIHLSDEKQPHNPHHKPKARVS